VLDSRRELNWISKNLIEVLPAAVYVCNLEGVIVAFNRLATELWEELLLRSRGITPLPVADFRQVLAVLADVVLVLD
jgi:hypothetical protein